LYEVPILAICKLFPSLEAIRISWWDSQWGVFQVCRYGLGNGLCKGFVHFFVEILTWHLQRKQKRRR
jgi:hypothetical protein